MTNVKETAKLLICGDIIPTPNNEKELADGKYAEVFSNTLSVFENADFRFCNLEGVFTERGTAITKAGPNIRACRASARVMTDLKIDLVGLANNHSLDWGKEGLCDTLETLEGLGVDYTGAGMNLSEARRIYRFECKGHKLSIIDVAEHEFTIARDGNAADPERAGANPFDPYDTLEDIVAEKADGRTVIVVYHGGKEHYPLTSPNTKRRCRKMAERGADFIFCQHTHCICCYEEYAGCHICYGQGNTLFGENSPECWLSELLPTIVLEADGSSRVEYTPVSQYDGRISIAEGETADKIMQGFYERSARVLDDKAVTADWKEFYMKNGTGWLRNAGILNADNEPWNGSESVIKLVSAALKCQIHHESVTSYLEWRRAEENGRLLTDGQ